MRRIQVFILVFIVTLSVIFGLLAVGVYLATSQPSQYPSSWVGQMWGGMGGSGMGGMMGGGGNAASSASYYWVIPASLIAIGAVSGIGLAFYLAFPEIRIVKEKNVELTVEHAPSVSTSSFPVSAPVTTTEVDRANTNSFQLIEKTMTSDEKRILDVLIAHDGKYLQKYIRSETGLSRLQTHRIVARFAERGIVTVRQVGNTNEILISDWLRICNAQKLDKNA